MMLLTVHQAKSSYFILSLVLFYLILSQHIEVILSLLIFFHSICQYDYRQLVTFPSLPVDPLHPLPLNQMAAPHPLGIIISKMIRHGCTDGPSRHHLEILPDPTRTRTERHKATATVIVRP